MDSVVGWAARTSLRPLVSAPLQSLEEKEPPVCGGSSSTKRQWGSPVLRSSSSILLHSSERVWALFFSSSWTPKCRQASSLLITRTLGL